MENESIKALITYADENGYESFVCGSLIKVNVSIILIDRRFNSIKISNINRYSDVYIPHFIITYVGQRWSIAKYINESDVKIHNNLESVYDVFQILDGRAETV